MPSASTSLDQPRCHPEPEQVVHKSGCPRQHWHTLIAPLLARDAGEPLTLLLVGANKGYQLAEWASHYSVSNITSREWHARIIDAGCLVQCCGVCNACRERKAAPALLQPASLRLHAFELQPATAATLRRAVAAAGLSATVHEVAVSNSSRDLYVHRRIRSGKESERPTTAPTPTSIRRAATTLDAFLLGQAEGRRRAHLVSIDTEGFDGLVLRGAAEALRARRIDVIEFEPPFGRGREVLHLAAARPASALAVHAEGSHARIIAARRYLQRWFAPRGGLGATLGWLGALGYACFWQGNGGALAEASGECWRDCFGRAATERRAANTGARVAGRHFWANLVCSHRADVLRIFRSDELRGGRYYHAERSALQCPPGV